MNIFETAARKKLRFPSTKGELTAEQLFDLPLVQLDTVARSIHSELKSITEESFIDVKPDPRRPELETKLEIVKHVIAVKVKERDDAIAAQERAAKRRKLLDAIAAKEDEALTTASKEDLLKQLAALDG
jgi:hypothetical protein